MKKLLWEYLARNDCNGRKNIYKSSDNHDIMNYKSIVIKNVTKFVTTEMGEDMFNGINEDDLKDMVKYSAERLVEEMVHTILKERYPNREISFELLQVYAVLYAFSSNVAWEIEDLCQYFDGIIGVKRDEDNSELVKLEEAAAPENIGNESSKEVVEHKKLAISADEPVKNSDSSEDIEKLKNEIEKLRLKLHPTEQRNIDLNLINNSLKARTNDIKAREMQFNSEHEELVALRNYVYNLTSKDDINTNDKDIDAMKQSIKDKRVIIIGGHPNWVAKVRREFPDWRFLSPDASGTTDGNLLVNTDYIYFFTDCIKHNAYYKYINIIRKEKLRFGYIHDINIEANIRQIYSDMSE